MRTLSIGVLFLFRLLTAPVFIHAQDKKQIDSIQTKFEYYRQKNAGAVLYAHFDKTMYTNGENVWFTAYLMNDNFAKRDVLSTLLVRDDDHSVVLREKFVMKKGIALGNLLLPDSIASGNYSFILYANNVVQGKPRVTFVQPVTVKNTFSTPFNVSLALLDSGSMSDSNQYKVLLTTFLGSAGLPGAIVKYYFGNKSHPLASGSVKTDKAGEYLFNLPADKIWLGNNKISVNITYKKEERNVELILPVRLKTLSVRFYPEGGNLSEGIESKIGWEVKSLAGLPFRVTGVLYQDDKVLDTISTDSYGMGNFRLIPNSNSRYHVKLLLAGYADSVYWLPTAVRGIPIMSVPDAIAGDTLAFNIRSIRPTRAYLIVHNYRQPFFIIPVDINKNVRKVNIVLDSIPTGIAEVTLLDSNWRPFAERLFFAHYDKRLKLNIATNKDSYEQREKVDLKLRLEDKDGQPFNGLVSIACVQANRLELKKSINIDTYYYLNHPLGQLPEKEDCLGNTAADGKFLENILLIKGWRRYTWHDLSNVKAADTLREPDSMTFTGMLTRWGKPFKKPATIAIVKDSSFNTILSEAGGRFWLKDEDLFMINGKKAWLYVSGENRGDYQVNIHDPYLKTDSIAAKSLEPVDYDNLLSSGQKLISNDLTGFEHFIRLKEVKIVGNKDNFLSDAFMPGLTNECGDYVCLFNILNCPNHVNDYRNRPPKMGETYTYNHMPITYNGCVTEKKQQKNTAINGIYYSMEFYPADYSQLNPSQPEYISTIYWNHLAAVSSEKDLDISFYASDITGDFKIIVQGVSSDSVVHAEKTIRVVKPQGSK